LEHTEVTSMSDRILAEATPRFIMHGYNGISMREIAEACSISKAALYYHFTDKEDLIVAILGKYLDQIECLIRRCREAGGTAAQQIERVVQAIFLQPPNQRSIIRLASQEMPNLSEAARQRFGVRYQDQFIGQFESMLEEGMTAGEFQPLDVHLAAWILLGMMYPFFYPRSERDGLDMTATSRMIVNVYFKGIQANG
jgi:AcrR family transcriptional regulator